MEAVNQLLVALEVHRFGFCFIGAGYEKEVDEFLTVNPGLAGRFNRKLRFESYAARRSGGDRDPNYGDHRARPSSSLPRAKR